MKKFIVSNNILDYLMYIFYAIIPIYFMQFSIGPIFNPKVLLGFEIIILMIWIYKVLFKIKSINMPNLKCNIYLYGMVLFGLIASIFAFYPLNSAITICIIGIGIVYYIMLFDSMYYDYEYSKLSIYLNINNITCMMLLLVQVMFYIVGTLKIGKLELSGFYYDYTGGMITSLFANPNTFAMYLSIGLYSNMLLINIKREKKHVNIINILILMVAIILSGSRTALISTVLVIGLYLIFINNILKKVIYILEKNKKLVICLSVGVIILIVVLLTKIDISNIPLMEKFSGGSRGRVEKWIGVLDLIKDNNIIFGVGNIDNIMDPYYIGLSQTHNAYVNLALRGGIGLLTIFGIYIVKTFTYVHINIKKLDISKSKLLKTMIIIIVGLLITQMFEMGIIFTNVTYFGSIFFMLIMAYIYIIIDKPNEI